VALRQGCLRKGFEGRLQADGGAEAMNPLQLLREIAGEWDYSIVEGQLCVDCADVHPGECPRSIFGDCAQCGAAVSLNRFGTCRVAPHHQISNRRFQP